MLRLLSDPAEIEPDRKIPRQFRDILGNSEDKSARAELSSAALIMKSIIPDPAQLDELAAGLDAGWDDEPAEVQASPSEPPHSAPLPAALDELDADWDTVPKAAAPAASPARSGQSRPNATRPSPARPSPTRAVTPPVTGSTPPVRATKQERRDAERRRRAHEAQQKAANKKQRKVERQAEAQRASEQQRADEQQALVERRARQGTARKRPKPKAAPPKAEGNEVVAKPIPKRVRRQQAAREQPATEPAKRAAPARETSAEKAPVIVEERGAKKLIVPFLIALLFAVTLGFALSRAH